MNVVTTKRIYYLELNDYAPEDGKKVFGIRFVYPEKDLNASLRKEAEARAANPNISGIDKANVNIDYSFSGDGKVEAVDGFRRRQKDLFQIRCPRAGDLCRQCRFHGDPAELPP